MTNINSNPQFQLPKTNTTNALEKLLKNIKEQNNSIQNNKNKLQLIEVSNDLKLNINQPSSPQNKGNNPTTLRTDLNSLFESQISDREQSIDNHFLNFNSKNQNCIQGAQATEFSVSKNQIVNDLFDSDFRLNNNTFTSENNKKYVDELFNTDNILNKEDSINTELNNQKTLLANNNNNKGFTNTINAEEIQINGNEKYIKPEKVINELTEENKGENIEEIKDEKVNNENDFKVRTKTSIKLIDMTNEEEIKNSYVPQEKEFLPFEVFDFSQGNEMNKNINNQPISVHIKNNGNHDNNNFKGNESLNNKSQINKQTQNANKLQNQFQHNANIFASLNMTDILQNVSKNSAQSNLNNQVNNNNNQENENKDEIRKSSEREILSKKEMNLTLSNNSLQENNNDYINQLNQEGLHIKSNERIQSQIQHQNIIKVKENVLLNKKHEKKQHPSIQQEQEEQQSLSINKNNNNNNLSNSFMNNNSNESVEHNNSNKNDSQDKISEEIKENVDGISSKISPMKIKSNSKQMQSLNYSNNNSMNKGNLSLGMINPSKSRNVSKEEINSSMFLSTISKNKSDFTLETISNQLPKETSFTEYISKETHINEQYISYSKNLNRKKILFDDSVSYFKYNNNSSFPSFSPLAIYTDIILTYYLESLNKYSSLFNFISADDKISYYNTILSQINEINTNGLHKIISNSLFHKNEIPVLFNIQNLLLNETSFSYWRKISSQDGNSFYISFAFAYIEQLILSRKINEINSLIVDLFRLYEFEQSVFNNIDIYNAKISINIIYDFIQCEKHNEAIDYLIMCFNTNNDLVKLLVTYMKYCIVIYATDFEINYLKKEESENYNKQNKINYINNNYALSNFQNKMILYHNEPCYLLFKLIPFIFNVNLTISYLESTSHQQFQTITFTKNNNNENDVLSIPIHLGYFIYSYHVLYKENLSENNQNNETNKTNNTEKDLLSNFELNSKKSKCPQCKNKIHFIKHCKLKYLLCSSCLQNAIISILKQRFVYMYKDNFISKEYYLQPINIELSSSYITISLFDFISLYKISFNDYFNSFKICYKCLNIYEEASQVTELSCSCQFCVDCLLTLTEKVTEGYVIQNIFEKIHKKISKCYCNNNFNLEQAIDILTKTDNDLQEYKDKAKDRLKKYALGYCMICKKCFFNLNNSGSVDVSVDSNIHSYKKYHRVKIISNKKHKGNIIKGIDFIETEHIICNKCFEREVRSNTFSKRNKKNMKKNNEIDTMNQSRTLFCGVCNIEHDINEYQFEGRIKKSCCGQGCAIL